MIKVVFISLKLLELIIFFVSGNKISESKSKKEYWKYSIIPILTYAMVEGLRFGRNVDWNLYYFRYIQFGANYSYSEDYEPLFRYICYMLYQLGVPYYGFIFIQCLFFIFCVFVLLQNYKEHCKWMIPLILVCITSNENFIRWYLAFSFLLLSINSLVNKHIKFTCIWFLCAFFCHSGIVIFIILIILYKLLNKFAIPKQIGVILMFISTFIMTLSDFMFLTHITSYLLPFLGDSVGRSGYLNATEDLLSGTWGKVGIMEQSSLFYFRIFVVYAPVIYWGRKILVRYKAGIFFYNIFVIGAIVFPLFGLIEIFNRISGVLVFFFCIVGGLFYNNFFKKGITERKWCVYIAMISFIFAIYPYISDIFTRENNSMLFIWDANGRNYLPF